jgi:UDP-arabinose 4-epimerase
LKEKGYLPVSYDNLSRGHRWAVRWGPLEVGDLFDAERLHAVIERYRPAAVLHFAGFGYVGESVNDPALYYRNNVAGTVALLDAMRRHGLDQLVFSSTCATYGVAKHGSQVSETTLQNPISPYGRSKWMVERILHDYLKAYGLRSVSLRYFNAAGADPELEVGELHEPEPHVIPNILLTAAGRNACFTVNGTDHDTPDGTCVRDYTHVSDLAEAHVLALQALREQRAKPAYNLGNGRGYSIMELIRAAERVTDRKVPTVLADARPGDPPAAVADPALAYRELNWTPRYSNVDDMLLTAWRWMEKLAQHGEPNAVNF